MSDYLIPRPRSSAALWLLSALVVVGLVALFLAAFYAFSKVTEYFGQAVAAALLIEAGIIVEAILIIRRNVLAVPGLVVSLAVSGTYNYIQAQHVGALNGVTSAWQLGTLAIGPLSALVFLSLAIGHEIREQERRVVQWEQDRQAWYEEQARKQEEAELKERKRQERREDRLRKVPGKLPEARQVSGNLPADWRQLSESDKEGLQDMEASEIVTAFGVSARTARNWKTKLSRNGTGEAETEEVELPY